MHIPQTMLQGAICPVTAALSVLGLGAAGYASTIRSKKPTALSFGAVTALIFGLQMLNFPIQGGTSGHLLGGVLASALLGIPFGVLALTVVVTVQALIFSDGGLAVLGANILNMALIGAGVGGMLFEWGMQQTSSRTTRSVVLGAAAWTSVVLAALTVSVQLAVDGQIAFATVLPAMVGTHALIGIGEALITLACYPLLHGSVSVLKLLPTRAQAFPVLAASVIALLLAPFASQSPDGLEWVAERYHFLHESASAFVSIMPDYVCPWIAQAQLSTWAAGAFGMALCFSMAWAAFYLICSLQKRVVART